MSNTNTLDGDPIALKGTPVNLVEVLKVGNSDLGGIHFGSESDRNVDDLVVAAAVARSRRADPACAKFAQPTRQPESSLSELPHGLWLEADPRCTRVRP